MERARQRRLERQLKEEQESKMLSEAVSQLKQNGENHVNHREMAETQTGEIKMSQLNFDCVLGSTESATYWAKIVITIMNMSAFCDFWAT